MPAPAGSPAMLLSVSSFTSCFADGGCVVFQLLGGLSQAMVLFLIASGLSLIFGAGFGDQVSEFAERGCETVVTNLDVARRV